jgi:ATP adenylyltransferase/5',5'''-P-1,P-4-tetraphosphate phosphorylase II
MRLPHAGASREHRRQSLQLTQLSRTDADRSLCIAAAFFTMQKSARFPGKCTIAVQFAAASITSVFRKQSVVKDRFSSAVKPVNRKYNEGCK